MKVLISLVSCTAMASAACKSSKPEQAAGGSAAPGSAAPVAPTPSNAGKTGCDLAGDYRLRFKSNNHEGWWFRFRVADAAGAKAELTEPVEILALEAGPLVVKADPTACKLAVSRSGQIGEMRAELVLDAKSDAVSGSLIRKAPRDDDEKKPVAMAGVRDVPGAAAKPACIVPGVYELKLDPKAKWKPDQKKKFCAPAETAHVRVELLAGELVIDQVDVSKHNSPTFGSETVKRDGDCAATVTIGAEEGGVSWTGKLTFADGKVTGIADEATLQMVEDGTAGENLWGCKATGVAITGTRGPG